MKQQLNLINIQRNRGLTQFKDAYKATYITLAKIRDNEIFNGIEWNVETRATAAGLYKCMQKFDFIISLINLKK